MPLKQFLFEFTQYYIQYLSCKICSFIVLNKKAYFQTKAKEYSEKIQNLKTLKKIRNN